MLGLTAPRWDHPIQAYICMGLVVLFFSFFNTGLVVPLVVVFGDKTTKGKADRCAPVQPPLVTPIHSSQIAWLCVMCVLIDSFQKG